MRFRLIELLKSPDTGKSLKLSIFEEKSREYGKFKLLRNPMCSRYCALNKLSLPTKKIINCKDCFKREIISGFLLDGRNVYPIINGIPRLLPRKMQSMLVDYHHDFFQKYKNKLNGFDYGGKQITDSTIKKTLKSYSYQWQTFDEIIPEWKKFFNDYLSPFNKESFFKNKSVLDVGCGYGRFVYHVALNGAEIVGFDLSEAVQSAYKNTSKLPHAHIVQASIYDLPFVKDFDFVYCVGVIQHTPHKDLTFKRIAELSKKGNPLYIWVYSKRKGLYNLIYLLRPITTRMPYALLYSFCYFLAIMQYIMFLFPYKVLTGVGLKRIAKKIPYSSYANYPFRHNHADWFDRLSVPMTDGFSKQRVFNWFKKAGFKDIHVVPRTTGWRGWGVKR